MHTHALMNYKLFYEVNLDLHDNDIHSSTALICLYIISNNVDVAFDI